PGYFSSSIGELTVTPGHRFVASDGTFRRIDEILAADALVVLADGATLKVGAEHIAYAPGTSHLYDEAEVVQYVSCGGTALKPQVVKGWRTYNLEIEKMHTYIAAG